MAAKFSRARLSRRTTTTSGLRRGFAAVALTAGIAGLAALGMAGLVSSPAGAAAGNGNNGSVKIAQVGDVDGIPNNQPHQGCVFTVQWYNFDQSATSTVSFTMQAPTTGGVSVSGNTSLSFAGGKGLDHVEAYTLTPDASITPQAQQGYHVTLTVQTTSSKGHSIVKHKTFWFSGCGAPPSSDTTSAAPCTAPTATETVTATVTATVTEHVVSRDAADPCVATVTATVTETATVQASSSQSQTQGIPNGQSPSLPVNTGAAQGEHVSTPVKAAPAPEQVVPTRIESGLVSLPTASQQHTDRWPLFALAGLSALLGGIGLLPRRRTAKRS